MGRIIDADNFKWQVAGMTMKYNFPVEQANAFLRLIDNQPTAINGKATEAECAYQRTTYISPVGHHYEESEEKPYIKYSCPVCDAVGNLHQVMKGDKNCASCGVNLGWGEGGGKNDSKRIQ